MSIRKIPFHEPAPDEVTEIYEYGDKIDLVSKKYSTTDHIKIYKKHSRKEMVNIYTGKKILIKPKENKNAKEVFKQLKVTTRVVIHNIHGNPIREWLIELHCNKKMTTKQARQEVKRFWEKAKRRLPKGTQFIRILIYHKADFPEYDIWITAPTEITVAQHEIKKLWEDGIKTIDITAVTKETLEEKATYFLRSRVNMEVYKPYEQILGTSKGIKQVKITVTTYDRAKNKCKGYKNTYQGSKSQTAMIDSIEQETQLYTYQTYEKNKRTVELRKTNDKRYTGKKAKLRIIASAPKVETNPVQETITTKEKEVEKLLEEIGQEVQKRINIKKGGKQYDNRQ